MISTITNRGRLAFMVFDEGFTVKVFLRFLRRLVRHVRQRIFLIVDRHPAHRAVKIGDWLAPDSSVHDRPIYVFTMTEMRTRFTGMNPACRTEYWFLAHGFPCLEPPPSLPPRLDPQSRRLLNEHRTLGITRYEVS